MTKEIKLIPIPKERTNKKFPFNFSQKELKPFFFNSEKRLILNSNDYNFPIKIKLVVCSNEKAEGLKLAKKWSIPYLIFNNNKKLSEEIILVKLKDKKIELIL